MDSEGVFADGQGFEHDIETFVYDGKVCPWDTGPESKGLKDVALWQGDTKRWRREAEELDVLERAPIELHCQLRDSPRKGTREVAQFLHRQRQCDLHAVPLDHEREEQRRVRRYRHAMANDHARRAQDAGQEPDRATLRRGALLTRRIQERVVKRRQ